MATTDRNTLKSWFVRGSRPLAAQFAAWIDSFWHKDEALPISSIENLNEILAGKIDRQEIDNISAGIMLERRIPISMEATEASFFLSEAMTIYKIEAVNVSALTINGTDVELKPVSNQDNITETTLILETQPLQFVNIVIGRTLTDARADLFIYAKAKIV